MEKLIRHNSIIYDNFTTNYGIDKGYFIHGIKDRKVLVGCEQIHYCPICGDRLPISQLRYDMLVDASKKGADLSSGDYDDIRKFKMEQLNENHKI
jgi:hypothetical protein